MGEKETTLKEVGEMLAHVVEHMATKEELGATNKELKSFRRSLMIFGTRRDRISEKSAQNSRTFGAMSRN
jgi:hypothetical protein